MRRVPGRAGADLDPERDVELDRRLRRFGHDALDHRRSGGDVAFGQLEHQLVVDLEQHLHFAQARIRERGYSQTLFGRKTWFPRIDAKIPHERQGAERAAINAPIQGTSADIIKRAMVRMMPALEDAGLGHVRMLLQVHDELVFELPEGDVAAASPVIERVMAEAALPAVELTVPLGIEIGHGMSWDAAH